MVVRVTRVLWRIQQFLHPILLIVIKVVFGSTLPLDSFIVWHFGIFLQPYIILSLYLFQLSFLIFSLLIHQLVLMFKEIFYIVFLFFSFFLDVGMKWTLEVEFVVFWGFLKTVIHDKQMLTQHILLMLIEGVNHIRVSMMVLPTPSWVVGLLDGHWQLRGDQGLRWSCWSNAFTHFDTLKLFQIKLLIVINYRLHLITL